MKKLFSTGAWLLLVLGIFRSVIDIFEDNYVTTMINVVTSGDTMKIAVYHIVKFGVCPLVAFITGRYLKRHYIAVMRFGIVADLIFFLLFSQLSSAWLSLMLTAAVQGMAFVMYYLPLNFIMANWVQSDERHKFLSYNSLTSKVMSIALPVFLGGIIYTMSYARTIAIMIVVVILQLATLMLAKKVPQNSKTENTNYDFIRFVKKSITAKNMRSFSIISFCRGLVLVGAQSQIINLLIIARFGNEYELGKITSLIAVLAMITLYVFGKFANKAIYRKITVIMTVIQVSVVTFLLLFTNTVTIILIKLCFDCVLSIINLISSNYCLQLSNSPLNETCKTEFFVFQELGMNAGRVVSWIMVIFATMFTAASVSALTISIVIITIVFVAMSVLLFRALRK